MRLLISLTILTIILSCEKQREQVEKFVFDNKQITSKNIYRYDFDKKGRIKTSYSTSFMYMAGVLFDSMTHIKQYKYNDKGQITKIFDSIDSTWQTKLFNKFYWLVADYTINQYSDTTHMIKIDYLSGRSHKRFERKLSMKIPENFENLRHEDLRNYDTLWFISEFIYEGDRLIKSKSFEKDGTLAKEIEFIYNNGKKIKTITHAFIGESKYIKETTIYSDNNTDEPDEVTTGIQGDTIGFKKTIFQDGNRITINYIGNLNMQDVSYYDKKGRLIGTVLLDLNEKVKTVHSYVYDDKGNVIVEANYSERINNTR